jgi:hypothetical protein
VFAKSPAWYRNAAVVGLGIAILMIPALEAILHAQLSLLIRVPLVILVLNAMAGGSIVVGICVLEYQQRAQNVKSGV